MRSWGRRASSRSSPRGPQSTAANDGRGSQPAHRQEPGIAGVPDLGPVAALTALALIFHRNVPSRWWTYEDPQVLIHALTRSPAELLFQAEVWRTFSASSFFPLLPISFQLDLAIAGVEPAAVYVHQWVSGALAAVLCYLTLRFYLRRSFAALAAAGFAVSPLMVTVVGQAQFRHYLEGLVFSFLATLFWQRSARLGYSWATALAYLLAVLQKEVYAPLPLLFLVHSHWRGLSYRPLLLRLLPTGLVALFWMGWRSNMLGSIGGYRAIPSAGLLLEVPRDIWQFVVSPLPDALRAVWLVIILVFSACAVKRSARTTLLFALAASVFVLLPYVPVAELPYPRYAFTASATVFMALGLSASTVPRPLLAGWLLSAVLAISAVGGILQRRADDTAFRDMVAVGRYLWERPSDAPALILTPYQLYVEGISTLRRIAKGSDAPQAYVSAWGAALDPDAPEEFAVYRSSDHGFVIHSRQTIASRVHRLGRERSDAPLQVKLVRDQNSFRWDLGPPGARGWTYITVPYYEPLTITQSGWKRMELPFPIRAGDAGRECLRIKRTAPDWSWTVSPVFCVSPGMRVNWSRSP
jgi:hypothetical protein